MKTRNKVKLITTIICMVLSLIALYAFCFVVEVAPVWRVILLKHESQTVLIRLGELIRQAMVHGQEFFPAKVITLGVMR